MGPATGDAPLNTATLTPPEAPPSHSVQTPKPEVMVSVSEPKRAFFHAVPFILLHLGCLAVFWVGWSWPAVAMAVGMYVARMFAITGFYHRYFSHKSFHTSRVMQFLFAVAGNSAVQRGPLWWAAHHRHHHRHSDEPEDVHSPVRRSFLYSHVGWIFEPRNWPTKHDLMSDLNSYPELRLLDKYDKVVPMLLLFAVFFAGYLMEHYAPSLGATGMQMIVWGLISTVALWHGTFTINSLAHTWGSRVYNTTDTSRNNFFLALITLGEGWHNNHHHFPGSARNGFRWWEVDLTYYGLWMMSKIGLVWDLRPVPAHVMQRNQIESAAKK